MRVHSLNPTPHQVPTDSRLQILPGDEIVQINEQVVVRGGEERGGRKGVLSRTQVGGWGGSPGETRAVGAAFREANQLTQVRGARGGFLEEDKVRLRECSEAEGCRVASEPPAQFSPAQHPCPALCPVPQVGWPHKNVVRELLREPDGVSLVLKKVPVPETPSQVPAAHPCPQSAFRPLSVASSITCF